MRAAAGLVLVIGLVGLPKPNVVAAGFDANAAEQDLFSLVNQYRQDNGQPAAAWEPLAAAVAQDRPGTACGATVHGRAQDMIDRNYLSGTIPPCGEGGIAFLQSFGWSGYGGEMDASAPGTLDSQGAAAYVFKQFRSSYSAQLLAAGVNQLGVGWAVACGGWTAGYPDGFAVSLFYLHGDAAPGGAGPAEPGACPTPSPVVSPTPLVSPTPGATPRPAPPPAAAPSETPPASGSATPTASESTGFPTLDAAAATSPDPPASSPEPSGGASPLVPGPPGGSPGMPAIAMVSPGPGVGAVAEVGDASAVERAEPGRQPAPGRPLSALDAIAALVCATLVAIARIRIGRRRPGAIASDGDG